MQTQISAMRSVKIKLGVQILPILSSFCEYFLQVSYEHKYDRIPYNLLHVHQEDEIKRLNGDLTCTLVFDGW